MKVALVEGEPLPRPGTPLLPLSFAPPPASACAPSEDRGRGEEVGGGEGEGGEGEGIGGPVTQVWREAEDEGLECSGEMRCVLQVAQERRRWERSERMRRVLHEAMTSAVRGSEEQEGRGKVGRCVLMMMEGRVEAPAVGDGEAVDVWPLFENEEKPGGDSESS
jgi:hypothetical protein